jgi:hypothetical protein
MEAVETRRKAGSFEVTQEAGTTNFGVARPISIAVLVR